MLDRKLSVMMLLLLGMLMFSAVFVLTPVTAEETRAKIWTDKADYFSGETAIIYGSGFNLDAVVNMTVTRPDATVDEWAVTSDSSGSFTTSYVLDGITGTYTVTATDGTNTATTTFTDSTITIRVSRESPTAAIFSVASGATFSVTLRIKNDNTGGDAGPPPPKDAAARTDNGNWALAYSGLTLVSGPAGATPPVTSGTFSLAPGSYLDLTWTFQAPTGPVTGLSITLSADITSVSPSRAFGPGDKTSDSISYTVNVLPPPDTTPPDTSITAGPTGWIKVQSATFTWTGSDDVTAVANLVYSWKLDAGEWSAYSSATSTTLTGLTEGSHTFYVRAKDEAGNVDLTPASQSFSVDITPPTVSLAANRVPDSNGWYNHVVGFTVTANDALSGVVSTVTPPDYSGPDSSSITVTGSATDAAGNTASASLTFKYDATPPIITASYPSPNAYGWYNTAVTVDFTATDALSGIDTFSEDVTLSTEGADQSATATATDKAGNSASLTIDNIDIDMTPPTITGSRSPDPNAYGWNNVDVTVSFTASDELSGIDTVTSPVTLSGEGAGQSVTGTAVDKAGNSASATVGNINIDKTPPSITGAPTTAANAYGWYKTDVVVHFEASDSLSGLDTVTPDQTLSSEGAGQSVTGSATDKAGNSASYTVSGINIDKTPPTITGSRSPAANAYGWNNVDVTVHFEATDSLSGVDTITPDVVVSSEGASQSVTGTATDKAGNSASFTVSGINIDKTLPTISGAATTNPNAYGWYKTDVVIHFEASDALSGIAFLTPDITISTEGAGQSATGTATDKAGNTASYTVSDINIDKTPPTITGAPTTSPNAYGWYNTNVIVHFTASDSLSGLDTVTPDQTLASEGAGQSVTGTAVDKAGNSASYTVSGINIDKTPPVVTITLPNTGQGSGKYYLNEVVSASWSATDSLSGVVPPTTGTIPIDTSSVGPKTLTISAGIVTDFAGNPSAAVTATYSVVYAYSGILQPINPDGSSIFKLGSTVPVKFQLRDANGNFVTNAVAKIYVKKISDSVSGSEMEAVSTSAATTGNLFRYDPTNNQYIFNLNTKPLSVGTWQIRIELDDGTSKYVNISLR